MDAKEIMAATARELEEWPGVTEEWQSGAKHMRLLMTYAGRRITVITSASPSDNARGLQNHIAEVRRSLRQIGATRTEQPKSTTERVRNKPDRPLSIPNEPAPTMPDPFEALAEITWKETHMAREITINGKTAKIETGIPVPELEGYARREKSDLRLLIEALKVNESVFVPMEKTGTAAGRLSSLVVNVAKVTGDRRFVRRWQETGYRVWCIAGQPAVRGPRVNGTASPSPTPRAAPETSARSWA